ncbi:hypothetical protein KSC_013570 [Ktedonobacter sp. SOSP1-52]|uniref:hypothetical protein n=1 Tax=Ktedonobacter sp. SOSP1-52 TaxID=2778366 RepID=UPI0019159B67|nr:hypothetical protein [Ktedonobacter sp. SOSP1-52]GHO62465.1 hypothetical protein KSC_013570 [Ktedonobacter sp. SOSP1-52]
MRDWWTIEHAWVRMHCLSLAGNDHFRLCWLGNPQTDEQFHREDWSSIAVQYCLLVFRIYRIISLGFLR